MSLFSSWYNRQYASWNRTRNMQAPPFLARTDTRHSRAAAALHSAGSNEANPGDVVINMGNAGAVNNTSGSNADREKKSNKDTLFGPSIGAVGSAPSWCGDFPLDYGRDSNDEKVAGWDGDELTPDIVKEWEKRSKDPSEPTTTLQALVNLKRPTIRLSPLASSAGEHEHDKESYGHHQQHGLEFEFDCDAPQCAITLHVIGVPAHYGEDHPDHDGHISSDKEKDHLLLYEATVPGGFARKLSLSDGAILELAKLEAAEKAHRDAVKAANASKDAAAAPPIIPTASSSNLVETSNRRDHKRRFTFFRKKSHANPTNQTQTQGTAASAAPAVASGPALAVVDAEAAGQASTLETFFANGAIEKARRMKEQEENAGGVKVAICLSARNEDGKAVGGVRNDQVTFLWVMKHGPVPTVDEDIQEEEGHEGENGARPSTEPSVSTKGRASENEKDKAEVEDTRPWVVKVVKREARIGPHAFQLHEIYGLTAHSTASEPSHPTAPTAPAPSTSPTHTYPPAPTMSDVPPMAEHKDEDSDASGECLLCLSSPREVVLLPCRHLVACRECAVNMVEFGAGGTVSQPAAEAPPATTAPPGSAGAESGTANGGNAGEAAPSTPLAATGPRRKRKAKGWFCPVCRQPYTSLLRITTSPPAHSTISSPSSGDTDGAKRVSLSSSLEPASDEHGLPHPLADNTVPVLSSQPEAERNDVGDMAQSDAQAVSAPSVTPSGQVGGERADERV